jgi:hypothetical protein
VSILYLPTDYFEVDATEDDMAEYQIKIGNNGKHYAVFKDSMAAEDAQKSFADCVISCFDGYDNAYELNSDWWHRSGRTKAGNSIG